MIDVIKYWYQRYLTHPEAGQLVIGLVLFFAAVVLINKMLAPVFFSLIIAYVLEWAIRQLERAKLPRWLAVIIVFLLSIGVMLTILLILLPMILRQLNDFVTALPDLTTNFQARLSLWLDHSHYISTEHIQHMIDDSKTQLAKVAQSLLSHSLSAIPSIITFVVYFVMVPLLVYFFLMDKYPILRWCNRFLPKQRPVLNQVLQEVNQQIGNYIRGKVLEAFILGITTYAAFALFGLRYAVLLATAVGLSVFIPYIGAVVATIPVVIIAMIQFGLSSHFAWLIIVYATIMALDGTVLVSVLFSETNSLHPVIIIVAILVFGGLFGFWGVFFAIPLASLFKALMTYWPVRQVG